MLSDAVARTVSAPVTWPPLAGAVTVTVGSVVSRTVTVAEAVATLLAASLASAVRTWAPGATFVAFQDLE
jgi:hypothetical protein